MLSDKQTLGLILAEDFRAKLRLRVMRGSVTGLASGAGLLFHRRCLLLLVGNELIDDMSLILLSSVILTDPFTKLSDLACFFLHTYTRSQLCCVSNTHRAKCQYYTKRMHRHISNRQAVMSPYFLSQKLNEVHRTFIYKTNSYTMKFQLLSITKI